MKRIAIVVAVLASTAALAEEEMPIPQGPEPAPVAIPHFARRLDAFVFRNWGVVPPERMAAAIGAEPAQVKALARELGLGESPEISDNTSRRSALTIIRRNWHLLPYSQLLALLGWSEGKLGYTLREDDFLWIKLGSLKPKCEPIRFEEPDPVARQRHTEIRVIVETALGEKGLAGFEPRFGFIKELSGEEHPPRYKHDVALPGERDLSSGWTIELPENADAVARAAVERFRRTLREEFSADVGLARTGDGSRKIQILFEPEPQTRGSFKIESSGTNFLVRAGDGVGVLRALNRFLDFLEERGGPFLEGSFWSIGPRSGLRLIYSYFALYGDALLERGLDPYPDGYLAKLSRLGVNGVWLPVLLRNMAPSAETLGLASSEKAAAERETRFETLADLVSRARKFGIGVYLYLNEPRAMPAQFFAGHEDLRGVTEGDSASLCTSVPAVRKWMEDSVAHIVRRVPDLAGLFTITASENLTSCWSHGHGQDCTRCASRKPWEVIAEVNTAVADGLRAAGSTARIIAWDWGWADEWIEPTIALLPNHAAVMSVSEWSLPISRGGVSSAVGEYSLSAVGPGPRALRTWKLAKAKGLDVIAKVQAGNSWELSAVPYIPAVRLAADHAKALADEEVQGVMLGWTLGGYPSPNVEAFGRWAFLEQRNSPDANKPTLSIDRILKDTASRRFGSRYGERMPDVWTRLSDAFRQYPFHVGVVYSSPIQLGPANLLYAEESGYVSTMVGFPYDDLDGWRAIYPAEVYAGQLEAVARGWEAGLEAMPGRGDAPGALAAERRVATAALLHFQSAAAQARFVLARRVLEHAAAHKAHAEAIIALDDMEKIARDEESSARRLLEIVRKDSRIGFEASNQYYYMPVDLLEKIVSCRWIAETWIPARRMRL